MTTGTISAALRVRPRIVCAAPVEGGGLADAVLGVGKAASVMRATESLVRSPPPWLLLIGVCGAYPTAHGGRGPALDVGDLCVVGEDALADEGVDLGGEFRGLAAMGLGDTGPFPADPTRTREVAALLGAPVVAGATVSGCNGHDALSRALAGRSGARVETMEGAAVLQVCQHLGVPAVQLRCVSNRTGARDAAGWDLRGAVERLHAAVRTLARAGGWEAP
jgi:futalosine hydrolase